MVAGAPDFDAETALHEGLAHHRAGRLSEARDCYDRVLAWHPTHPDALHFMGLIAQAGDDLARAEEFIGKAIAEAPDRPTFQFNLGVVLSQKGDVRGAIVCFQRASELDPTSVPAVYNLGLSLGRRGNGVAAEAAFRQALELDSTHAGVWAGLGAALSKQGRDEEAEEACRKALAIDPKNAEALTTLGNSLQRQGRLTAAEEAQRTAIEASPNYATAYYNLGNLLNRLWRSDEAIQCFRRAIELTPGYLDAEANHLLNLLYRTDQDEESLFLAHRTWAERFDAGAAASETFDNDRDPDRRLRVGYLSPDFRTHSCAYFIEPLFRAHDRRKVEVIGFSTVAAPDEKTAALRGLADGWHEVASLDDTEIGAKIRQERIDILVDLAGLTRGGRIRVFANRAAPVQVSWLGYPSTTGLWSMDAWITDAIADPSGEADRWHTEELVRLEGGFLCYAPPSGAPDIGPPPVQRNRYVTFGSFNNSLKMTTDVIAAWAAILNAVPDACLLLKSVMSGAPETRARIAAEFAAHGVEDGRLQFADWIAQEDQPMMLYHDVDIALDPFPYNGTTTTFEALWMGVPVISMAGVRHAGRVGCMILTRIGCTDLIANSTDEYVAKAAALAMDADKLADLRCNLRARLAGSSLMDERRFANELEAAYRRLWAANSA